MKKKIKKVAQNLLLLVILAGGVGLGAVEVANSQPPKANAVAPAQKEQSSQLVNRVAVDKNQAGVVNQ